jgi:hypothetical protein
VWPKADARRARWAEDGRFDLIAEAAVVAGRADPDVANAAFAELLSGLAPVVKEKLPAALKAKLDGKTDAEKAKADDAMKTIAKPAVSENTYDGYEVAVRVHLVPGIGKHRIDRLEPEHLESLYRRMQKNGSKPATAHQAHPVCSPCFQWHSVPNLPNFVVPSYALIGPQA